MKTPSVCDDACSKYSSIYYTYVLYTSIENLYILLYKETEGDSEREIEEEKKNF